MLKPNIETYLCCDAPYEEAKIVLFGAPFDSTTSYRPGTRFGSRAIRSESYGLESYSPYQDKDLLDCAIFDSGDLELSFGKPEDALADIEERAATILADGKLPASDGVLIDTGLSEEELKEILTPGDMVTFRGPFTRLGERRFTAKALDDRSCAAAILYALELTKGEELPCGVSVLFSSQEEIGGHGAKVAAERLRPDQAIASDVSFALTPDADPDECGKMGDGAMIGVAPVLDRPMTEALKALAGEKGIPYQLELMGGRTGTNADAIFCTGGGVRTALISLPQKYMHSPIEIVDAGDIAAVGRLMAEYLRHPLPAARKEEA